MRRRIISVIAGVAAGIVAIYALESLSHFLYPPPGNMDPTDSDQIRDLMAHAPVGALVMVILAYALGSLVGGFTACVLTDRSPRGMAVLVGLILMAFGVLNLLMIPHPIWFWLISLPIYLPFAYMGYRIGAPLYRRST
jgi:hypothetical protein